ncbi:unnamed protein product [Rotaria socialis]|uniref:MULE transposase domain-containing protein n=2 Tax=Rotaria socialis TaxID=392032 RepID=A0A817Q3X8_9BILA|nr:unnamed protein product [Rotaria socialis]
MPDPAAAVYIYTMEWPDTTLYRVLNRALRSEKRQEVKVWLPYLKLFDAALNKLPAVKEAVWRGAPLDIGKNFTKNQIVTCYKRKIVSGYTEFEAEDEVILRMGSQFCVKSDPLEQSNGSYLVHLIEINKDLDQPLASAMNDIKLAAVVVQPSIKTTLSDHNHSSNPDEVTVTLLRGKMKERILAETTSITKIYDEEIVKANISKGATALIPTVVEFRSNMSKASRKKTPVIPSNFMFEIPDLYQSTLTEKRFLLIDIFLKRGQDRILIFASDQQLKLLYESSTIFMDGTFDIAPAPFKQVYLIHGEKFGQGLPVAFCLLSNKRGRTYLELFERLKEQAIFLKTKFDPKRIITDFEPCLLPVIQQEFPFAIHSGCMFHFNQAVHRKITDLGLASDYLHNEAIRNQYRQIMALSLMPIEQVHSQFQRLETITSAALSDLLLYFKNQWVHGVVPISM